MFDIDYISYAQQFNGNDSFIILYLLVFKPKLLSKWQNATQGQYLSGMKLVWIQNCPSSRLNNPVVAIINR